MEVTVAATASVLAVSFAWLVRAVVQRVRMRRAVPKGFPNISFQTVRLFWGVWFIDTIWRWALGIVGFLAVLGTLKDLVPNDQQDQYAIFAYFPNWQWSVWAFIACLTLAPAHFDLVLQVLPRARGPAA